MAKPMPSAQEFWDGFYTQHTWAEHGPVNRHLLAQVEQLTPGRALDLGCGEGSDTIWLAEHGWTVTAVDVSDTALERARVHADRLGLAGWTRFERHDLTVSFPPGEFDLVSAQFLHSPVAAPGQREAVLHRAAQAVAPGGHLLVVSHWAMPAWHQGMPATDHPVNLTVQTPQENRAALQLQDGAWRVVHDEVVAVEMTGPEGQPGTRHDHVLHVRRLQA